MIYHETQNTKPYHDHPEYLYHGSRRLLFKFPDNFCFGGITGFATVVAKVTPISASNFTFIANTILLVIGFIFLGKSFALKTTLCQYALIRLIGLFEKWMPLTKPLSNEPMLDRSLPLPFPPSHLPFSLISALPAVERM